MSRTREVYLLDPQKYSPETIAVAFGKTSRSPESFRQIASELTGESSAEFNEKWVVGYGHSSIAEHAVLHIAVENISRLAVECLESNRLASYTEKSTRYQKWNVDDFFIPEEFSDPESQNKYIHICHLLFTLYENSLPALYASIDKETPVDPAISGARRKRIILTAAGDVCRFFLPVAAFANVGVTINARNLEHAITKMLSHPLKEVRVLGGEIKQISQQTVPTLVKYANEQASLISTANFFQKAVEESGLQNLNQEDYVIGAKLLQLDNGIESRILTGAFMRYSDATYAQVQQFLHTADQTQKDEFLNALFAPLDSHDIPIRELEYGSFLFDIILDQGAYLELKRHRMMTQTPSPFTPRFGYAIPKQIVKAGLLDVYTDAMNQAQEAFMALSKVSQPAASYVLPNAFNRQVLIQTNFRTLYHFLALRTAPTAHFSMRRIAQQMADQVKEALPNLGKYIRTNTTESASEIEERYFYHV
jgi:thymidylate synthase ThyX